MQISKLFSFIAAALLVSAALVSLVSIPAVAQAEEATPSVAVTTAAATAVPSIVGATKTNTIISASNNNPKVGGNATIYVYVRAGTAGLPGKSVHVNHTYPGSTTPGEDGWFTTGSTGIFSFPSGKYGSAGSRVYTATFAGDSQYASSSGTFTVNVQPATTIPTLTTISASPTNPFIGLTVTFTVNLNAGDVGLSKRAKIWHTYPNPAGGAALVGQDGTVNIVNGVYKFTQAFASKGQRIYHAEFAGDSSYASSSGNVTVNVKPATTKTTTTTFAASTTTPKVGQTVTFTVNLKSGTTGLSKSVKIWHTTNGVRWEDGTHTTTNGVYSFTQAFGSTGQRIYHAEFAGDSSYAVSSGAVTVNVGKIPTTTTITASNLNPPVETGITLTITVKAGTTVLTNKQVTVTHTYPGSTTPATDGVFNTGTGTKTFASGTYGSAGQRVYTATFAGDGQYAASTGTFMVNVGKAATRIPTTELKYVGAFRLPSDTGDMGWPWAGGEQGAMTYYPKGDSSGPGDGYPGSIYATGNDQGKYISEVSIPVPVNSLNKNINALNTASTLQPFKNVLGDEIAGFELPKVSLEYLAKQGAQTSDKLYFAVGQHLQDEQRNPSHGWMGLAFSNKAGLWKIDNLLNYLTTYYIFSINKEWADAYTPNMYLATGRFRDGGMGSQGPCLIAYGPWNEGNPPASGTELPSIPLLLYSSIIDSEHHTMNGYSNSDEWNGGAWLTSGDKSAVIFVGTKGVGNCWYGYSDGTVWPEGPPYPPVPNIPDSFPGATERGWWSTSSEAAILFYDPADLAAVAQGKMQPYEPQPYAKLNIDQYLFNIQSPMQKNRVGAVAYDRGRGYLYVLEPLADNYQPLIHVWSLTT